MFHDELNGHRVRNLGQTTSYCADFGCKPFQRNRSAADNAALHSVGPKTSAHATTNMGLCLRPRYRCSVVPVQSRNGAGPSASRGSASATDSSAGLGYRGTQSSATGHTTTPATTVRVVQRNAEGIQQNKPELQAFLRENNVDIICIQETYLKDFSSEDMTSSVVTDRLDTKVES